LQNLRQGSGKFDDLLRDAIGKMPHYPLHLAVHSIGSPMQHRSRLGQGVHSLATIEPIQPISKSVDQAVRFLIAPTIAVRMAPDHRLARPA
jgi:hypothetical protein